MPHSMILLAIGLQFTLATTSQPNQPDRAPEMVDGIPLASWQDAAQHTHREAIVYGKIVMTKNIGSMVFLNFDTDFRNHFTVVIKKEHFEQFPPNPEQTYLKKVVAVRGQIIKFKNKPEMIITTPEQIVILPDDTSDFAAAVRSQMPSLPDPSTKTASVSFATINLNQVLDANDAFCQSTSDNVPGSSITLRHIESAKMIRELNADVIAIQNTVDQQCFARYQELLLKQMEYQYFAGQTHPQTGLLGCSILSRYPLEAIESVAHYKNHNGEEVAFSIPPLKATITVGNESIILLVINHHREHHTSRDAEIRDEITGLKQLTDTLLQSNPNAQVVLSGGFGRPINHAALAPIRKSFQVPGLDSSQSTAQSLPLIATLDNFILVSDTLTSRYVPGSTHVEQSNQVDSAVTLSLQVEEAISTPETTPSHPDEPARFDDPEDF